MDRDQELAIKYECAEVHYKYYILGDEDDFEGAVNCMTEDFVSTYPGLGVTRGRDGLLKSITTSHGPCFFRTYVSNLVVTVIDEQNAEVMSYVQQYFHEWDEIKDGKIPVIQPGTLCRQDNKCVLTDDGWKISRRHVTELLRRA